MKTPRISRIKIGDYFDLPTGRCEVIDVGDFIVKVKWMCEGVETISLLTPRQLLRYPCLREPVKNETQALSAKSY